MMRSLWLLTLVLGIPCTGFAQDKVPAPMTTGLKNPESVAVGLGGKIFVSEIGEFGKDGDGRILVLDASGAAQPFTTGLDDPKGLIAFNKNLYVTDKTRVLKIDETGKSEVFAAATAFPTPPLFLNDIIADEKGVFYVSDSGDLKGGKGAIYRIDDKGKVDLIADAAKTPQLKTPNGLAMDGKSHLLVLDFGSGDLSRLTIATGKAEKLADGFDGGDGLAWDHFGRLFISSWKEGKVWVIGRPGQKPELLQSGFQSAADMCLDPTGKFLLVPDMKAGTITKLRAQVPSQPVDDTPLSIGTEIAFPDLKWTDWNGFADDGKPYPLRPMMLTHAGDGSNRVFVPIQQGPIHVFPNDQKATTTKIFLDLTKRVSYNDKENEEGLLGLAFHPNYKKTGEFFVFYTIKEPIRTNVLSRFRVSKDDPDRADPNSEEELMRFTRPFWNHDGGTICFGPDGYLYIALGDGGSGGDPHKNGQNLNTLLAKILRIDIDRKDEGKKYAVPKDNPFVGKTGALPETWAYGFRNIWRMSFDRKTGQFWAADVGQNLYEEIDLVVKGGNYGWSVREGLHPFGSEGVGTRADLIEPIWEYHHDIGKSATGGVVYRGKRLPQLDGAYLYGDYISNKIWALTYDESKRRVVANRPIADPGQLILSFGEDEPGDVYFLTTSLSGKSIYRFANR